MTEVPPDWSYVPAYADPLPAVRYTLACGPALGPPDRELTQWTSFTLTVNVDAATTLAIAGVPGSHPDAAALVELRTDVWVIRDGVPIFRGRLVSGDDDTDAPCTFGAVDYRGVLARRLLRETQDFVQVEQADIAWALVAHAQAAPGGNYGITQGLRPTGRLRDRHYDEGEFVGNLLDNLSNVIDGFDYDVDTALRLNVWSPRRGVVLDEVLELGGALASLKRSRNTASFANAVRFSGGADTTTVFASDPAVATAPEGRWEVSYGLQDVILQETLVEKAAFALAEGQALRPSYTATFAPWRWMAGVPMWVGDRAPLVARSGRIDARGLLVRCTQLVITVDGSSGAESVAAALVEEPS